MLSEQPALAPHGMVACAHYLATQAGVQILTQGGNAIDAAIAANAVMTVVYPTTCSAGGDIFLLIWDAKTRRIYALNGSGRAPQGMTPEYFGAGHDADSHTWSAFDQRPWRSGWLVCRAGPLWLVARGADSCPCDSPGGRWHAGHGENEPVA